MSISYQWRKNKNITDVANNAEFVFSQLASTEDSAMYSCQVMASSDYLTGTVDETSSPYTISVTCKLHIKKYIPTEYLLN